MGVLSWVSPDNTWKNTSSISFGKTGKYIHFGLLYFKLKWKLLQNICFCSEEDAEMIYAWVLSNACMTRIETSYRTNGCASCCVLGGGTKLASLITWSCVLAWLCCLMRHRAPLSNSDSSAVRKLPPRLQRFLQLGVHLSCRLMGEKFEEQITVWCRAGRKCTDKEGAAFWSSVPLQKPDI